MRTIRPTCLTLATAMALLPLAAQAQQAPSGAGSSASSGDRTSRSESGGEDAHRGPYLDVAPYIEAAQVLSFELQPGNDTVTYTQLAAGVDISTGGRYTQAAASVRYERIIGYDGNADVDTLSGLARMSAGLLHDSVTMEAGALASRTRVEGNGFTTVGGFGGDASSTSQLYSIYAGPTVQSRSGPVEISGAYRLGYTRVESPDVVVVAPGDTPVDYFDDSLTHQVAARVGVAPNTVAPVGLGVGAGWNRQDISNLDQRIDDRHVRADVTVPVSPSVALVGGVGYEDVEISSRDALRDTNGNPVVGADGRLVTDQSQPRQIAYETDGLIWDAGVIWRPSRRTSLEAHVGRRYGSTTYYGSLGYTPNARSSLNVSVYDTITGFGGQINEAINQMGTDFTAFRNPVTGDLGACAVGVEGNNCALARLGSLRSSVFRSRGVAASYGASSGNTSFGLGAGYDRRSYIAGENTVLASVDGLIDQTFYIAGNVGQQLDRDSTLGFGGSVAWFDGGNTNLGDGIGYSASLAYNRRIWRGLTGTAAVGLDGLSRDELPDYSAASALLGLRYTFD
ncbi:MAG: preprotein translocase subunit YajC [Erythrobacter sp.]|nr:preprotein translocase subunit YajC [Erythrobacter sp.]